MDPIYPVRAWSHFPEDDIISSLEEVYSKNGYETKNFHNKDRVHELGTDLECLKHEEKIGFAVKKKPKKEDIEQLLTFSKQPGQTKKIYVFIESGTRPFEEAKRSVNNVTWWNAQQLHDKLVKEESVSYLCRLFSANPIADTLTHITHIPYSKKKTSFIRRKLTSIELEKLWIAKDNMVKMRAMLLNVYSRWTNRLMTKCERKPSEYQAIIDEVFEELDLINHLCAQKLTTSFEEIGEAHPDFFGLFWDNILQRTDWKAFAISVEKIPFDKVSAFVRFKWVMPELSTSKYVMKGFYSSINYILERFHFVAKNLEDGIDWVFKDMH